MSRTWLSFIWRTATAHSSQGCDEYKAAVNSAPTRRPCVCVSLCLTAALLQLLTQPLGFQPRPLSSAARIHCLKGKCVTHSSRPMEGRRQRVAGRLSRISPESPPNSAAHGKRDHFMFIQLQNRDALSCVVTQRTQRMSTALQSIQTVKQTRLCFRDKVNKSWIIHWFVSIAIYLHIYLPLILYMQPF